MSLSEINGDPVWTTPAGLVYFAGGDLANCTVSACPVELSVYGYRPSLAASGALIGLYAICMGIQILLGLRHKTWWFMSCMVLGCIDEIIGYVGRILYWQNPWGNAGFIIQIVLITIGPVFFAAAIYVLLSQVITFIGPQHSRFAPRWYIWVFIPCDIISLVLQAVGGSISSNSSGGSQAAVDIALAGLSFQVITLVVFIVLVIDFAFRSRSIWQNTKLPLRFQIFCVALGSAIVLILIRCAYRIDELSEGYSRTSEALRDQTLFIVLESTMVVLAAYCLIAAHPGIAFQHGKLPKFGGVNDGVEDESVSGSYPKSSPAVV